MSVAGRVARTASSLRLAYEELTLRRWEKFVLDPNVAIIDGKMAVVTEPDQNKASRVEIKSAHGGDVGRHKNAVDTVAIRCGDATPTLASPSSLGLRLQLLHRRSPAGASLA